jgi:hypothetical protein
MECALFLCNEVLLEAPDELPATVVAVMILLPVVNVPIFLILGGLAPRTLISDDHGLLLTSTGWVSVLGSTVTQKSVGEHYMDITTRSSTPCCTGRGSGRACGCSRWANGYATLPTTSPTRRGQPMASACGAGFRTRKRVGTWCSQTRRCPSPAPCLIRPIMPSSGSCSR